VSDEINACSIVVPVKMDGKTEEEAANVILAYIG
jgi:hypothetical protein